MGFLSFHLLAFFEGDLWWREIILIRGVVCFLPEVGDTVKILDFAFSFLFFSLLWSGPLAV